MKTSTASVQLRTSSGHVEPRPIMGAPTLKGTDLKTEMPPALQASGSGTPPLIRKSILKSPFALPKFAAATGLTSPAAPAAQTAASVVDAPAPIADFFSLEGFTRVDNQPGPVRVTPAVWSKVFPPDRPRVLLLVGRYFMQGQDPDAAVDRAIGECEAERWKALARDARLVSLIEPFGIASAGVPPACVQAAYDGVYWTALLSGDAISAANDPIRTAFSHRAWKAPNGRCLVCGEAAGADDRRFSAVGRSSGDPIHKACQGKMSQIGPVFGRLVIAEAEKIRSRRPPLPPAETGADPEDPSTYLDA